MACVSLSFIMDRCLDASGHTILDEQKFLWLHEAYITTSTIQWLLCLTLLGLTLHAWRSADRQPFKQLSSGTSAQA